MNKVIDFKMVPKSWTYSKIVPIPKKGDLTDPTNYRGITLMNSLPKIFMNLLYERIIDYV